LRQTLILHSTKITTAKLTYFLKIQIYLTLDRAHLEILHGHVDIIVSSKIKCKIWRWSAVMQWSNHFHENMTVQKLLGANWQTDKVIYVLISTYQIRASNPNQMITMKSSGKDIILFFHEVMKKLL
jgi:hypothetical protein